MSLLEKYSILKVSSVLNKDTKQFGKKYLVDGNPDTCWNSDQGKFQWIKLEFDEPLNIDDINNGKLKLQFQGGFSCKLCELQALNKNKDVVGVSNAYPEDINSVQWFSLVFQADAQEKVSVYEVKLLFQQPTDFFGRITLYTFDIYQCDASIS